MKCRAPSTSSTSCRAPRRASCCGGSSRRTTSALVKRRRVSHSRVRDRPLTRPSPTGRGRRKSPLPWGEGWVRGAAGEDDNECQAPTRARAAATDDGSFPLWQRDRLRPAARRLLRRGDDRRVDLLRHARHRQHRASGLHPPRLLRRLHRQQRVRRRSDPRQRRRDAGLLSARRRASTTSTTSPSSDEATSRCAAWRSSSACCSSPRSGWSWCSASTTGWSTAPYIGPSIASRRRSTCRCGCWCPAWCRWR